jgi:hypothetical protein
LGGELIHRDEEIRHEREKTAEAEASKRALDQQLRDCNAKIDEAEAFARAEGKRIAAKYEGRVSYLLKKYLSVSFSNLNRWPNSKQKLN